MARSKVVDKVANDYAYLDLATIECMYNAIPDRVKDENKLRQVLDFCKNRGIHPVTVAKILTIIF